MSKAKYSTGYTLDNNLQVVPEVRAYVVSADKRWSWDEVFPDHRFTQQYDPSYRNSVWRLKNY